MKIKQLSVFLENKPGHLGRLCEILSQAHINVLNMTLADTKDFGILRMIVREWEEAYAILSEKGFAVKILDVLAVEVPDEPGGLQKVLMILQSADLDIDYMYAFPGYLSEKKQAVIVLRLSDSNLDSAIEKMQKEQIALLSAKQFYKEEKV